MIIITTIMMMITMKSTWWKLGLWLGSVCQHSRIRTFTWPITNWSLMIKDSPKMLIEPMTTMIVMLVKAQELVHVNRTVYGIHVSLLNKITCPLWSERGLSQPPALSKHLNNQIKSIRSSSSSSSLPTTSSTPTPPSSWSSS